MPFNSLAQPAREVLSRVAESMLNRLLSMDPATAQRLRPLAGRRLSVELTDLGVDLCILFSETGLRLVPAVTAADTAPAARVRSSLGALIGLAVSRGQRSADIELWGDMAVVQAIRRLFADLELDWEEQLALVFGDVPAHLLGNAARGTTGWLRRSGESLVNNFAEYLTEERRDLPAAMEVSAFFAEVEHLARDVEHLAGRIERLGRGFDRGEGG